MYRYRGGMKMLDSNRVEMDLKPQTRHGRQKKYANMKIVCYVTN